MQCAEIMTKDYQALGPQATVEQAAALMRDGDLGFLPICEDDRRVVGILTDRDIVVRAVAENKDLHHTAAADIMTPSKVTCRPDAELQEAQRLMRDHQVARLLCVDDQGRLEGVISMAALSRHADPRDVGETEQAIKQN